MNTQVAVDTPWMTVPEVAAYARSSRTEVLEALTDESLRGSQVKPGGKWRVHRDDVDAWLRGLPAVSSPAPITSRRAS